MNDNHRIAIEFRSGIWLMFLETMFRKGIYRQRLLRIVSRTEESGPAEVEAVQEKVDRQIYTPTIIRDDSKKDAVMRGEN